MWIKVNDNVEIITGDDKGTVAKVLSVDRAAGKVVVEGVNRVYKHVRKSQRNPQGGRLSMEMPIQISNVMVVCSKCGKASRMGSRVNAAGAKERFCKNKRCNATVSEISPAKKA